MTPSLYKIGIKILNFLQLLYSSNQKPVDTRLGPKTYYKPQKETKDKSIIAVKLISISDSVSREIKYFQLFQYMTASKAMGALGLMNTRALEHPITGTQFLQEKVGSMNFLCRRFLLLKPLEDIFLHISASLEAEIEYGLNLYLF